MKKYIYYIPLLVTGGVWIGGVIRRDIMLVIVDTLVLSQVAYTYK